MRQSGGARSAFSARKRAHYFSSTHYSAITVLSSDFSYTILTPRKPHLLGQTRNLNQHLSLIRQRLNSVRVFGYRGAGLNACKWNSNTWRMGLATATMKIGGGLLRAMLEKYLCHGLNDPVLSSTLVLPRVPVYSTILYSTVHPQPQISGRGASW